MSGDELLQTKRAMLPILQARLAAHGARMWQMPLTFLGAVVVAVAAFSEDQIAISEKHLYCLLTIVGAALSWGLWGGVEGYLRTGKNLRDLESDLDLPPSTKTPISHIGPFVLLMVTGVTICTYVALTTGDGDMKDCSVLDLPSSDKGLQSEFLTAASRQSERWVNLNIG